MPKGFSCPIGQSNLISTLSAVDRALVEPHLRPVKLHIGMTLEAPEAPIELIYFPRSGVGSTVAFSKNGRRIETGLFGYEGMSGTATILQTAHTSHETFMQVAGEGLVIEPDRLQDLMEQSPSFQRHLLRYVQVMMTQTSQTALSNGQAKLEERLARWLLMCHDRINGNEMV